MEICEAKELKVCEAGEVWGAVELEAVKLEICEAEELVICEAGKLWSWGAVKLGGCDIGDL